MHKIGDAVQPLGRMKLVSALRNKMTLFNNFVLIAYYLWRALNCLYRLF